MEETVVSSGYVAMLVPGEPTRPQAEKMVRAALRTHGEAPWEAMRIDLYPGGGASLVIARPAAVMTSVYIDERALEFLRKRYKKDDMAP